MSDGRKLAGFQNVATEKETRLMEREEKRQRLIAELKSPHMLDNPAVLVRAALVFLLESIGPR